MTLCVDAKAVYEVATEHDGLFLLTRNEIGRGMHDAARWLVDNGYARWLGGASAPGIRLTGKPMDSLGETARGE